jgi:putative ABC transport system permease protein
MAAGLEKSSGNTGDPRNLMIVRKGSTAESSSLVSKAQLRAVKYLPQIARDDQGQPLVSADLVVLLSLPRLDGSGEANVSLRGLSPANLGLRPQVKLSSGRWFTPGRREVCVSARLAARFAHFGVGQKFRTGGNELTVTGQFDGGSSAFDSEVWMDADEACSLFDRDTYSSLLVRVEGTNAMREFKARIESDKRLPLRVDVETEYYAQQTMTAKPIKWLGGFLAIAMSVGAVFAAMNTMYASVGARTREIGTLRVLGFRRRAILAGFVIEGAILASLGGALGCLLSLYFNGYSAGTLSFNSFSEVVFNFRVTPRLLAEGMAFSIIVGVVGSLLPAIRAARLPVIASLKAV